MQVKVKDFFYLSNLLSLSRVVLVVPMSYLISLNTSNGNIVLLLLAVVVSATDFLDGMLSRKLHQVTDLGIILDPICDKIAMAIIFTTLVIYRDFPIPLIVFLLYRDLWIFASGFSLLKITEKPMMSNFWGKSNTFVFTVIAILVMMNVNGFIVTLFMLLGYLLIIISTISYGTKGLRLVTKKIHIRFAVWSAVILPTIPLLYLLRNFPFI